MRVIPPFGLFFLILYGLLIPLVGALLFFITGSSALLFIMTIALGLYLFLALRKPLRRRRALGAEFPGEWREFLLVQSAYFRGLDSDGRVRFERDVRLFLADTRIIGTGGRPVSWQACLLIAAGAASMLHGRPEWESPLADGVTVYPGRRFDRNYRPGKGNIAGQAPERGPLLVAEESLREGFADSRDGYNVLIHELAHFFDLEARKAGMELRVPPAEPISWTELISREYRGHDFGGSVLPAYAAQNEAEFFACASEMFFENPWRFLEAHPGVYVLLKEFYRQDPGPVLGRASK
jgi:Mlc titration factor MtfA (ptsG expression regulator)